MQLIRIQLVLILQLIITFIINHCIEQLQTIRNKRSTKELVR